MRPWFSVDGAVQKTQVTVAADLPTIQTAGVCKNVLCVHEFCTELRFKLAFVHQYSSVDVS